MRSQHCPRLDCPRPSGEVLNQSRPAEPLLDFSLRNWEVINICHLKLLNPTLICYATVNDSKL